MTRTDGQPRVKDLMGGGTFEVASRKLVSVMFLSLGPIARKQLTDSKPMMRISEVTVDDFLSHCNDTFDKKRNRTLDRFKFFSRRQKADETLLQFWQSLTGLAAKCEFAAQTESLVYDIFILNMRNKHVQEKLCTEPKDDPQDGLQYAVAYEEGILRQKAYGTTETRAEVKAEPVCAVSNNSNRAEQCYRCGMERFDAEHLKKVQSSR